MKRIDGNKLIAAFMGLTANPHDGGITWGINAETVDGVLYAEDWQRLRYDKDWNWLMPVVMKVRPLWKKEDEGLAIKIMEACFVGDIEPVWEAVAEKINKLNTEQNVQVSDTTESEQRTQSP